LRVLKSRVSRTRKITSRDYPSDYRGLFSRRAALYASRFSNRRGRDGTLLSACFPPPSDTKLFPTSNLPATMHPRAARSVCRLRCRDALSSLSLSFSCRSLARALRAELSFSALSRCDNSALSVLLLPIFLPPLTIFHPGIIYPANIARSFKAAVVRSNQEEKDVGDVDAISFALVIIEFRFYDDCRSHDVIFSTLHISRVPFSMFDMKQEFSFIL